MVNRVTSRRHALLQHAHSFRRYSHVFKVPYVTMVYISLAAIFALINWYPGPRLNRPSFPGMAIPMLKIRRSWDCLIFNNGDPCTGKTSLYWDSPLYFGARLNWCSIIWPEQNGRHFFERTFSYAFSWNENVWTLYKILLKYVADYLVDRTSSWQGSDEDSCQ